jgi:diguanylate cyclase (GGDEF)-like protein/PAS domain S-box-containing protein
VSNKVVNQCLLGESRGGMNTQKSENEGLDSTLNRVIFENVKTGLIHFNEEGVILASNSAFNSMISSSKVDHTGQNLKDILNPGLSSAVDQVLFGKTVRYKGEYFVKNSIKKISLSVTFEPLLGLKGKVVGGVAFMENLTELIQAEEEIKNLSANDHLTNLPNRSFFIEYLKKSLTYAERNNHNLAVIIMDLDKFKTINESLGYKFGDQVLQEFRKRLVSCLPEDSTLARFAGDEFIFILPEVKDIAQVSAIAEFITTAINTSWVIGNHELHITASLGISMYPNDGCTDESLIKHAQMATTRAKELGRNNFQFYKKSMTRINNEKLALKASLHKALEREEFSLHYQPQVDLKTNKIVGMEALLRWQHPINGSISPKEFIPLAEETGLIIPIGQWVLRTACTQNKAFQDEGYPPIRVAVNMSVTQFQQPDLIEFVTQVLEETGLDPNHLEIELTESVIIQDLEEALQKITKLKELGIHIAIDDFGTGYSSLSYLKNLFFDTLKIDQSFVSDVSGGSNNALISIAIINLARDLNLNVIAEGVETEEQLEFLKLNECNRMQGFLYSQPITAKQFAGLLH